jgi:hypothetical protein
LLLVVVAICCKLLQAEVVGEKCCRLLQAVAICCKTRKSVDSASRWARPVSIVYEGELKPDGLEFTAASQKSETGPSPLALAAICPTRHRHGAGYCGLGRNRSGVGMKLREVWEAAKLDGLEIPYPQFRVYVSRLRRRQRCSSTPQLPLVPTNVEQSLPNPPPDPFRNLREQREKKKQSIFEYDPFSINKNLIG